MKNYLFQFLEYWGFIAGFGFTDHSNVRTKMCTEEVCLLSLFYGMHLLLTLYAYLVLDLGTLEMFDIKLEICDRLMLKYWWKFFLKCVFL